MEEILYKIRKINNIIQYGGGDKGVLGLKKQLMQQDCEIIQSKYKFDILFKDLGYIKKGHLEGYCVFVAYQQWRQCMYLNQIYIFYSTNKNDDIMTKEFSKDLEFNAPILDKIKKINGKKNIYIYGMIGHYYATERRHLTYLSSKVFNRNKSKYVKYSYLKTN